MPCSTTATAEYTYPHRWRRAANQRAVSAMTQLKTFPIHLPPQVAEGSPIKRALFNWGYHRKLHSLEAGHSWDKVRGCTGCGGGVVDGVGERRGGRPGTGRRAGRMGGLLVLLCCCCALPTAAFSSSHLLLSRRHPSLTSWCLERSRRSWAAACAWWCRVRMEECLC